MKRASLLLLIVIVEFAATDAVFTQKKLPPQKPSPKGSISTPPPRTPFKIARLRKAADDLPAFRVVDLATGLVFKVYYDDVSKQVAEESIPLLAVMYRDLAHIMAVDAGEVDWSAVVFTGKADYIPPRRGGEVRWTIPVEETGKLGSKGIESLFVTIPHEQVHAIQTTFVAGLPRWFAEGQAEWAGLQATRRLKPELAEKRRAELTYAADGVKQPLNLRGWGGMEVKKEAILRQVTPEQRARMEKDSTYSPPGPFNFGPNDFVSDESNAVARYGAVLEIFERLEKNAGRIRLHNWFRSIWQNGSTISADELLVQARKQTSEDVASWLK